MTTQKLTISRTSVDEAIRDGLRQIGLPQSKVIIQILRKESHGLLKSVDAVVAITYDLTESEKALHQRSLERFGADFRLRFEDSKIKIRVPKSLFDEHFIKDAIERETFLTHFLETKEILDPDVSAIQQICSDPQSQHHFVSIKELATQPLNEEGGSIYLELSKNEMELKAAIFHHGIICQEDVYEVLEKRGFIKGIFQNTLNYILKNRIEGFFLLAKGSHPIDDAPGPIQKYFSEPNQGLFNEMFNNLTIDTRSIKEINMVSRNQLLLEIGDPIPGKNGYTVTGKTIPKQEAKVSESLNLGKNVYMNDHLTQVYAKAAGHIVWKADSQFLDVESVYVVEGNVDFSEGNVVGFIGKVVVKGDVKAKFSVIAEGDIEIMGSVEDAIVESKRGNVTVMGTVVHQNGGHIKATDNVNLNIAMNAVVHGKNIRIAKECINSKLYAAESCLVLGTPGVIVGGEVHAKKLLRAKTIGSDSWTSTKVYIGYAAPLNKEIKLANNKLVELEQKLKDFQEAFKILERKKLKQSLTETEKEEYDYTEKVIESLQDDISFYEEKINKAKDSIDSMRNAKLEVENILYPQVDVYILDGYFMPEKNEPKSGYYCKQSLIVPYSI